MKYPLPVVEYQSAIDRMGDADIYYEIARFFAAHLPASVVDLERALEAKDATEARRLAHSMKSNCAMVGAETLREVCARLEALCRAERLAEAAACFGRARSQLLALPQALLALQPE